MKLQATKYIIHPYKKDPLSPSPILFLSPHNERYDKSCSKLNQEVKSEKKSTKMFNQHWRKSCLTC